MLLLPAFRARLLPCSERWAAMAPTAQGRLCSRCQRVVQDFTHSQNPAADLAAARAAAPDGRACRRFAGAQVQGPPPLTRRRWFLVALVLVVAQGLSAREALAQVRQGASHHKAKVMKPVKRVELLGDEAMDTSGIVLSENIPSSADSSRPDAQGTYRYAERMSTFKRKGFNSGSSGIVDYIQRNMQYHPDSPNGKVFVTFIVDTAGLVQRPMVVKGLSPAADAEVIRVVKAMDGFTPGMSRGRPVAIPYTLPITLKKP